MTLRTPRMFQYPVVVASAEPSGQRYWRTAQSRQCAVSAVSACAPHCFSALTLPSAFDRSSTSPMGSLFRLSSTEYGSARCAVNAVRKWSNAVCEMTLVLPAGQTSRRKPPKADRTTAYPAVYDLAERLSPPFGRVQPARSSHLDLEQLCRQSRALLGRPSSHPGRNFRLNRELPRKEPQWRRGGNTPLTLFMLNSPDDGRDLGLLVGRSCLLFTILLLSCGPPAKRILKG